MILKSHHAENSRGKSKLILITFSRSISASDYLCCVLVLHCQPLKATCLHLKTHTDIRKNLMNNTTSSLKKQQQLTEIAVNTPLAIS